MSDKFALLITAHSRTRNFQGGKNRKTYSCGAFWDHLGSTISLLSFEGILPKDAPRFWIFL